MPNGLPEPGEVGIPRDAKSDTLCIPTFSKDTSDNDTAQAIYMSDRFFLKNVLRDEIIYEGTCPGLEASPGCCSGKGERVSMWQRWVGLTDTCHWTLFLLIFFVHFSTQLHFTFLTPPSSPLFHAILVMLFFLKPLYAFHAHEQSTRARFDWYYRTPNNSSTGLPTFRNSPVVVPPHPDPVLEPLLPPPNAPTTQSSGLPGHGAQVGVRLLHEGSW